MFFKEVTEALPDPVFGLNEAFHADPRPNKVNLVIGIYKDKFLQADLMHSVAEAKKQISSRELAARYLPIEGLADCYEQLGALVFGEDGWEGNQSRIYAAQGVGGTGALQVAGQFLFEEVSKTIAIPMQTWVNHKSVFDRVGFTIKTYPYYSAKKHGVDFKALCTSLEKMEKKTVILLHPVCHNPTGADLTLSQWRELSLIMRKKKLFPFFDFAYQGFGNGLEKDREAIELFLNDWHEMAVAYSCSKNFSLYCQRVGALFIVGQNASLKQRIGSHVKKIIRSLYSNPPAHGAHIVSAILHDAQLKRQWERELELMRQRVQGMREKLAEKLSLDHLLAGRGMFALLDLNQTKRRQLIDRFAVYLGDGGRISFAALNEENLGYVASSIREIL
jgi:aspartate/tyrosine/aromatic aminotransferase